MRDLWVIGVDCAVDYRNTGVALGKLNQDLLALEKIELCSLDHSPATVIAELTHNRSPVLLAIDAPLGWPRAMGEHLIGHRAGERLCIDPNSLFLRETDRFVKRTTGSQPLAVGADRIARTCLAALSLLHQLASMTDQAISLAWEPTLENSITAIEVYPAATLRAYKLQSTDYKRPEDSAERASILKGLGSLMEVRCNSESLLSSSHVLDAAVAVLAGADFLRGKAGPPENRELAEKEGWIWVRRPARPGTQSMPGIH